ncbi:MAG: amidohydrolase [Treponema sp.]|nr:amidohydrolase [Treponema sp.]
MKILDETRNLTPYMVDLRNYFHAHPELGLQEFNTSKKIEEELDKIGLEHVRVGDTNVIATIDSGKKGKTLLLRADIDALPIQEANDVPYKSQNKGIMHACGHDGHTASLLGAAKILIRHKNDFTGRIILAFQAAEEIGKGARDIIDAGILDTADRCFGIHFQSSLPVGTVGIRSGADMASCDRFKITVSGKSAHITCPDQGIDALFIASLTATKLQTVVSRLVNPAEGALIGVGRIESGTSYNIIAGNAELEGTIRTFTKETREKLQKAVTEIASNTAKEYGGSSEIFIDDLCDPVNNDEESTKEVITSAEKIFGKENVITGIEKRFMADNFADYFRKAPGCYVHVGSSDGERTSHDHHNEHFDLAETCYAYAAALHVQYALDYLK